MDEHKNKITILLVGVNVVIFFILSLIGRPEDGSFLVEHGAMYAPYVIEGGEYYRLFTAMFLHFDFYHLMNNMIMLAALGMNLEPETGSVKLLLIYLASGLGGNLLSLALNVSRRYLVVSAGASGAVFGLMGAMVWLVIRNKGRVGRIYGQRIFLMVALSLYFGFASTGVDNYAHVGGLITGFFAAVLLYRKKHPSVRMGAGL